MTITVIVKHEGNEKPLTGEGKSDCGDCYYNLFIRAVGIITKDSTLLALDSLFYSN